MGAALVVAGAVAVVLIGALARRRKPAAPATPMPPPPVEAGAEALVVDAGDGVKVRVAPMRFRSGGVDVAVFAAWTEGLAAKGREELVLYLRHDAPDLRGLAVAVAGVAATLLDRKDAELWGGDWIGFREPMALGAGRFGGVVVLDPNEPGEPPVPDARAVLVGIAPEDVEVVRQRGVGRVLARMAARERWFPAPFWTDPARPPVARPEDVDPASPLAGLARVPLLGWARGSGIPGLPDAPAGAALVELTLLPLDRATVAQLASVPEGEGLLLLTRPDPFAGVALTWEPGQRAPAAAHKEGADPTWVGGSFLALAPTREGPSRVLLEDGFAALLPPDELVALRAAIALGRDWTSGPAERPVLAVRWAPEVCPAPGDALPSRHGWYTTAFRTDARDGDPARARLDACTVWTPRPQLAHVLDVDDLDRWLRALVLAVRTAAPDGPRDAAFQVLIDAPRDDGAVACNGPTLPSDVLEALGAATVVPRPPTVRRGRVRVLATFTIAPS